MEAATATVIAAGVGALAGISGGLTLEAYKRRRDTQGVAQAIAGAIETEVWAMRRRGHVEMFEKILPRLRAGESVPVLGLATEDQARNPLLDAYMEKFGMLPGDLPGRVSKYAQISWSIRIDVARYTNGHFNDNPSIAAHVVEQDLAIWKQLAAEADVLVEDLRAVRRTWPRQLWDAASRGARRLLRRSRSRSR